MKKISAVLVSSFLMALMALSGNAYAQHANEEGSGGLFWHWTGSYNTRYGFNSLSSGTEMTGSFNTADGAYALRYNTTGGSNTANGADALLNNSIGSANTATGASASAGNTTGSFNTATGRNSLTTNQSGSYNTATGYDALTYNTSSYNTATGADALQYNTTGTLNTASGYASLNRNVSGDYNTAAGSYSLYSNLSGQYNTASGADALRLNTGGDYNTASGYQSLQKNTTGDFNTATGASALVSNSTGSYNSAHGSGALARNSTGRYNTANGASALQFNSTGSYNTASGYYSLNSNTTGRLNTASGSSALRNNTTGGGNTANGYNSLYSNTTGFFNTATGYQSLYRNQTGFSNTSIGFQAGYNAQGSGNVFIGTNAGYYETGSNKLYIANSSTSSPLIGGDFSAGTVDINGDLTVNGRVSANSFYKNDGTRMMWANGDEIHIGTNSMVFTDSAVSATGADIMSSSIGRVQIGRNTTDTTNVVGSLSVNGTDVMGSIGGLGEGVKATTALNAAFAAVPAFSGDSKFECGVGTGAYGDKYALAGSCGVALTEAVSFNAGASVLPSGSESYGVGTLPAYALKAGLSIKFGPSIKRQSIAALSNTGNNGFDRLALSDARNEADTAKLVAAAALERAASLETIALANKAKADAATQELNEMKQKVAALEAYKDKVDVIFAALQNNGGNLNLASYKH